MRLRFLISEAFVNIRRNALMVLGATLAVFVTIALTFGALLFRELVRVNAAFWEDDVRVIAFVDDDLTPDGVDAMVREVTAWDDVARVSFVSKAEAYDEAVEFFKSTGQEFSLRTLEENPAIMPASIRVAPVVADEYRTIQDRLAATPGVIRATSPGAGLDSMIAFRDFLSLIAAVLAVVLGISALVLIANTIRLAIYARREEVGIMKLVGASNWFVRVPFLLEGMFEGLVGGALAFGLIWAGWNYGIDRFEADLPDLFRFDIANSFFIEWGIILLALGVLVGVLGSGIALRRFLREA